MVFVLRTPGKDKAIIFITGDTHGRFERTELLESIESRLSYEKWYCGHYHTEKKIDKLEIMFENFDEFCSSMR